MTTFAQHPTTRFTADGLLARAYLAGNEDAFAELFRRYYPDVLRYVRASVRDQALAEDVAQETMTRALRYLHSFDPTQPLWPWLRRITRTVTASELARRASEVPVDEVTLPVRPDSADAIVLRAAVEQSLRTLPKRQRRALTMRYVEDRDPNDIAALFGLSRNALEQLMLRARNNFDKEYRARNAAVVPVFGPFVARLRRLVASILSRLQHATGTTMSVAGDVALGAALTVGGLGVATLGGRFVTPPSTPPSVTAEKPGRGGSGIDQQDAKSNAIRVRTDARSMVRTGELTSGSDLSGGPAGPRAWPTTRRYTPPPTDGEVGEGPTTSSEAPPVGAPKLGVGDMNVGEVPTPPPGVTPSPSAPPDQPEQPEQPAKDDQTGADPLPEPTIWADGEETGAAVTEDEVSGTSNHTTVKNDPTDEGEVANSRTETDATGSGKETSAETGVHNDDGSLVCEYLQLFCW